MRKERTRLSSALLMVVLVAAACGDDELPAPTRLDTEPAISEGSTTEPAAPEDEPDDEPASVRTVTEPAVEEGGSTDPTPGADQPDGEEAEGADEELGDSDDADRPGDDSDEPGAEADVIVDVVYAGGTVEVDERRLAVDRGSTVALRITSEVSDHVHVHGYDVFDEVPAGETTTIVFTVDVPGLFEVELEDSHQFLLELQVR